MASYTVQVTLPDPDYTSSSPQYEKGDIVYVYPLVTESPNPNGKLGFIHVHNVPEGIDFDKLCYEMSRHEVSSATETPEIVSKRAWMINMNELTEYQTLTTEKEINIDWLVAVTVFIRKLDGITGGEYYTGLEL